MLIFCINLAASTDRRQFMQQQFDRLQFPVDWIDAVDGRQLTETQLQQLSRPNKQLMHSGKRLVAGEIGCVLSHQKAYHQLLESNDQSCVILEDDVDLSKLSTSVLDDCRQVCQQAKPVIILLFPIKQYYNNDAVALSEKPYHLVKSFRGLGAFAYMINREAADFLVKFNTPVEHVVDPWNYIQMHYPKQIAFFAVLPALVTVDEAYNSDSAIDAVSSRKISKKRNIFHVIYSFYRLRLQMSEWWARLRGAVTKIPKGKRNSWELRNK